MTLTPGPGGARGHYPPTVIELDHTLVVRLRPLAAQRDLPLRRFVADILDAVAMAGLVDAVLDADIPDED
jgi:hypothetical protein